MKKPVHPGDSGQTGLPGGRPVEKDSLRIEAIGALEELNSALGVALSHRPPEPAAETLRHIQDRLFRLGADLAHPFPETDREEYLSKADVEQVEMWMAREGKALPPLRHFLFPGGSPVSATLQWARTVCRRAERRVVSLARAEALSETAVCYLNRLGDYLFVLARWTDRQAGVDDQLWRPE